MTEAAADGMGIAYVPDRSAHPYLDSGKVVAVLDDWCSALPRLFLYYPAAGMCRRSCGRSWMC
jgi:DNA-binding transcriptional LysR family regulator